MGMVHENRGDCLNLAFGIFPNLRGRCTFKGFLACQYDGIYPDKT